MNMYVGNLSRDVTEEELRQEFAAFGQVTTVSIIKDKYSGQARGFAFVEMASKEESQQAITALNGKKLRDRQISVTEARPRQDTGGSRKDAGPRRY
jgi:cold-inducible RNA-binding protein